MEKYQITMCDIVRILYNQLSTEQKRKLAKQMRNYFNSAVAERYSRESWHQAFSSSES